MIKIKNATIRLNDLKPQIVLAVLGVVQPVFAKYGSEDVVITSANDAKHSKGSRHYDGNAVDLRVWYLSSPEKACDEIQAALNMDFDCIFEGDHIHLEYHPKRRDL